MRPRSLQQIGQAWSAGGVQLSGLPSGATAHAVSRLVLSKPDSQRAVLVIVPDSDTASTMTAALGFYLKDQQVRIFPADDSRPYSAMSPHPSVPRGRLLAMQTLLRPDGVVVASAAAMLHKVLPLSVISDAISIEIGKVIEPTALGRRLAEMAYGVVDQVLDEGTFRVRGDRLDLWPTGATLPVRVEFFGDEVESIHPFDPDNQRRRDALQSIEALPAGEMLLTRRAIVHADGKLQSISEEAGHGDNLRQNVMRELSEGIRFPGCEEWLGAFHEMRSLISALDGRPLVITVDPASTLQSSEKFATLVENRFLAIKAADRPLVPPSSRYAGWDSLKGVSDLEILPVALDEAWDFSCNSNDVLRPTGGELTKAAAKLAERLQDDWRVGMVVDSALRGERITQLFAPHGVDCVRSTEHNPELWLPGKMHLVRGDLPDGFHSLESRIAVLSADDIFGKKVRVRHVSKKFSQVVRDKGVESFSQLQVGDLVVHRHHGVGQFIGITRVELGHSTQDMVQLAYKGGDGLYIPAHKLDELARYRAAGEGKEPTLDKLGGESWSNRKNKVRDAMLKFAHEMLALQARREVVVGHSYSGISNKYRQFEDAFQYQETPDQAAAIVDVLEDLSSPEPMDRLIVGDVGFGKTEVAMRAAMRVAEAGKQSVILCPTTVLAFQHYQGFVERFEPFGIKVALLSRFKSERERKAVKSGLKSGEIDIVVGTTGVIGRAIKFANLGLVVVDEEHRFGIRQKEALKRFEESVDYLALSATPIPRSLHLALSDLRKFSIVATPPRDRLPITTAVAQFSVDRIRETLLRELKRGGQAFFVHNRVATIHAIAEKVREAVPEAIVVVAHGQMKPKELEEVLVGFINRKAHVLVCTAIIESGVDIANVNTIIVNRADRFGLAQLYQLRGRVGRSHRRAFCTLLLEEGAVLTKDAGRRLRVLQDNTALGSGFAIASADMEIRGAGDLLGRRQHGQIQAVGYETYLELLEEAIATAKGEAHRVRMEPEVELPGATYISEEYVPGVQERLGIYKKVSAARSIDGVKAVAAEIEDIYGPLPLEALSLLRLQEVKAGCRDLGIGALHWLKIRVVIEFEQSPDKIEALVLANSPRMKLKGGTSLEVSFTPKEATHPHVFIHWLFQLFRSNL